MKRVLLFVIDALTGPLLLKEMEDGRYPHFQKLRESGQFFEQCLSIFPSITHAALTSIATGHYPAKHGVVASHWYDPTEEKVVYFSSSLGIVLQKGLGEFFREFLVELNNDYLNAPTIFQLLERQGYETACINFPIYRGDVPHQVNMPLLLKWIPGLPANTTIRGPKKLLLGDLLANPNDLDVEASFTGVAHWFGFRDKNTIDLVLQMAAADEFPDFTLAYFPENDFRAHEDGPVKAHKNLNDLDEMLGCLFDLHGGPEPFLQKFVIFITGDHSHSETFADEAGEGINLAEVLADYPLARAGQSWSNGDSMMPCPNLRSAQLYFKQSSPALVADVIQQLLKEQRIDQVMVRGALLGKGAGYVVQTQNGRLRFWPATDSGTPDRQGNYWAWDGDLTVVDGRVKNNCLIFPEYPNAFERIAGVLNAPASGHLWLTAKLGHEIMVPSIKTYPAGGSHASLHRLDSQPPLLAAGLPEGVTVPEFPRIIDLAPLSSACLTAG